MRYSLKYSLIANGREISTEIWSEVVTVHRLRIAAYRVAIIESPETPTSWYAHADDDLIIASCPPGELDRIIAYIEQEVGLGPFKALLDRPQHKKRKK